MRVRALRFAAKRYGSSCRFGRSMLLSLLVGLCFTAILAGNGWASIVRYDVVSGVDNLGNPVSGSLYVESVLSPDAWLGYDIAGYVFHSSALDYAGEDGTIYFMQGSGTPNSPEVVAGNTSIRLESWSNYQAGVWFYDEVMNDTAPTVENYSALHDYIRVADLNWRWGGPQSTAHGLGDFIFQAAPVPLPPALFLLAPGLAGLMALRRRLRP